MKYPYNTLLPTHLQDLLHSAASIRHSEPLDKAIREVQEALPHKFHTDQTVGQRVFFHEPRQSSPRAGFMVPYAGGLSRK